MTTREDIRCHWAALVVTWVAFLITCSGRISDAADSIPGGNYGNKPSRDASIVGASHEDADPPQAGSAVRESPGNEGLPVNALHSGPSLPLPITAPWSRDEATNARAELRHLAGGEGGEGAGEPRQLVAGDVGDGVREPHHLVGGEEGREPRQLGEGEGGGEPRQLVGGDVGEGSMELRQLGEGDGGGEVSRYDRSTEGGSKYSEQYRYTSNSQGQEKDSNVALVNGLEAELRRIADKDYQNDGEVGGEEGDGEEGREEGGRNKGWLVAGKRRPSGDSSATRRRLAALEAKLEGMSVLQRAVGVLEEEVRRLRGLETGKQGTVPPGEDAGACPCPWSKARDKELSSLGVQVRRLFGVVESQRQRVGDLDRELQGQADVVQGAADLAERQMKRLEQAEVGVRTQQRATEGLLAAVHAEVNQTRALERRAHTTHAALAGLYADHGYFYSSLEGLAAGQNVTRARQGRLDSEVRLARAMVGRLVFTMEQAMPNSSAWQSVFTFWRDHMASIRGPEAEPEVSTSHVNDVAGHVGEEGSRGEGDGDGWLCVAVGLSRCHGDLEGIRRVNTELLDRVGAIQQQADDISLDVEQLKDEARHYYGFGQSLQERLRLLQDQTAETRALGRGFGTLRIRLDRLETRLDRAGGNPEIIPKATTTAPALSTGQGQGHGQRGQPPNQGMLTSGHGESRTAFQIPTSPLPSKGVIQEEERGAAPEEGAEEREGKEDGGHRGGNPWDEHRVLLSTPESAPWGRDRDRSGSGLLDHPSTSRLPASTLPGQRPSPTPLHPAPGVSTWGARVIVPPDAHSGPTAASHMTAGGKTPRLGDAKGHVEQQENDVIATGKGKVIVRPSDSDVCALKRIKVSRPKVIASMSKTLSGTWLKDPESRDDTIYVFPGGSQVSSVQVYRDAAALRDNNATKRLKLSFRCGGTSHVVYNGSLYCHKVAPEGRVVRMDLRSGKLWSRRVKGALTGDEADYPGLEGSGLALAVDEVGLWLIYASAEDGGRLALARLDPISLRLGRVWLTSHHKAEAAHAFVLCGRLYVVRYEEAAPGGGHSMKLAVDYIYDTTRGRETAEGLGLRIHTLSNHVTSLLYNPKDSKLYTWDMSRDWQGQLLNYDVYFHG